ncbi:MAG: HAD-IA family hydrolase [Promethearchaeia archaeon]
MGIKEIIFDLGGVFFTRGTYLAIEKIKDIYNIDSWEKLREIFEDRSKKEGNLLRKGLITMEEFEQKFISHFDINIDNIHHIQKIWFGEYVPHYGMKDLVKKLRKDYRLLIFSGNIRERVAFLDKRYDFLRYFDETVFSYDYQLNKRNMKFYDVLLDKLQYSPENAVLIDDEKRNVKMAKERGMNACLYYYTEQLIEELSDFGIEA